MVVRRFLHALVAVSILASLSLSGPVDWVVSPVQPAAAAPVAEHPPGSPARAAADARALGRPVLVTSQLAETRDVYANPDGTFTAEISTQPIRVRRGSGWAAVDTTLVRRPSGAVEPRAAAVDLSLSGGGSTPLVRYGKGAKRMVLSWPGKLPVPQLKGDTATYPEVFTGVDLQVKAHVDGYSHYLKIKHPAAAKNLTSVRFGLRGSGVTIRQTPTGALQARDTKGKPVFAAGQARMWDAADKQAVARVVVDERSLTLHPDRRLLDDPATRYPVTIDPIWQTQGLHAWTSVLSGKADTEFPNSSGDPPRAQVGLCYPSAACQGIGIAWSYFQFDTSFLAPASRFVLEAWLDLTAVHSPDCSTTTAQKHHIYEAHAAIHPGTNWINRPSGNFLGWFWAPKVNAEHGCGGWKGVGLGVTNSVNRGGTTTWTITAENEGDGMAWRKYQAAETKLRVRFNDPPNTPTNLSTDPPVRAACTWCAGKRYLGDEGVRLKAQLTDPNNEPVRPLWAIDVNGVRTDRVGAFQTNGQVHDTHLDLRSHNNKTIEWHVKGDDGVHGSDWAIGVPFVVDRHAPDQKPNVLGTLYQEDNRWHGGVGVPGTFSFDTGGYLDPSGVADIDHFLYGWSDPPTTRVDADRLGGKANVTLAPPGDGPQDLFVQMVDRAGHRSPTRTFHIYVRAGNGPLAQWSYDGNADDEAFLGDRNGTLVGPTSYVPGAVGSALRLEQGGHVTAPNTLRTSTGFSVSAWVRLDQATGTHAAVSQSGQFGNAFQLGYKSGKWMFSMKQADQNGATDNAALSAQSASPNTWTHLTGVYDAPRKVLRLYVNGVPSGTAIHAGEWDSTGLFRVGNALNSSALNNQWLGAVDEVKAYDRIVSEAEIRAAVGNDNVQVGHWKLDETSGSTGRNVIEGGHMLALSGGAGFTGGAVGGALQVDGIDGVASTSGPVVRTDQSFSVAAWVKPDRRPGTGNMFAALSQDGTQISGFFLGLREDAGGVWEFSMPGADSSTSPGGTGVRSTSTAQVSSWTHLAAVYDAAARQVRLYVNGVLAGSTEHPGGFDATGPFRIGRGQINAGPTSRWPGAIDEVRAYSRELSPDEIQGIVARSNVTLGNWRLDGNANDSSGNNRNGTLQSTPDWTGGQSNVPDQTDLAVRLDGVASHITTPNTVATNQSFSVSAWARLDKAGGTATVVSQDGNSTSGFVLQATSDGYWYFGMPLIDSATTALDGAKSTGRVQLGVWTHLAGVYSKERRRLELFVNGLQVGSDGHAPGPNATLNLRIGRGRTAQHFPGGIDDVSVWGRPLFAEEIRTMAGRDLTLAHNHRLDEGSGRNAADAVGSRNATLVGGARRAPGRIGNALQFDGVDDAAGTTGVDIRTDASFTVAAWVYLDRKCDRGSSFVCKLTATSVDGAQTSKFRLGHVVDGDNNTLGAWSFEMPESDAVDAQVTKAAVSTEPSDVNTWVHLVGVYDKATKKLWLYVNGTRIGDGTLNTPWQATGGLQLGRGKVAGAPKDFWPGRVDDVRLYAGPLDKSRISNLYHSYPVQTGPATLPTADAGHWKFDESTGTTAADASGRGLTATMQGGTGWIGGRQGFASWFDGTSGYAETAGPVLDTTKSFAVASWVFLTSAETTQGDRVIAGQDGSQVSAFSLRYNVTSRRWEAAVPTQDQANPAMVRLASTEPAVTGNWTHLALSYDATLAQLRLYVNGRLSAAQVGVTPRPSTGKFSIGRGKNGTNNGFFPRGIDDVRAFTKALSDGEAAKLYDDVAPVTTGLWRFDDNTVRDSSARENPTTATGTPSYIVRGSGKALQLDGTSSSASALWAAMSTEGSFTVSAWAKLSSKAKPATVLSQDGTRMSGFTLGYNPNVDRWVFSVPDEDSDAAPGVFAHSLAPAVLNQWVHLTGVYDHAARQVRLYIDGELAGTRTGVSLWPTTGGFALGRAKINGQPGAFFPGAIDEVRTELGMVPDDEIARRAGTP